MAETDPFGRDKGEDPLAEMGWSSDATTRADAGPADIAAPEQADHAARRAAASSAGTTSPPPASRYRPMRDPGSAGGIPGLSRRNRTGCAFGVVVLAFVGATAAAVVPAVIDSVEEQIDEFTPTVPDVDDGPGRDRRERQERRERSGPPSGLASSSLFRRGNLAPVLRRIRGRTGSSRVQLVRLDAEDLLVTTVRGNKQQLATATWKRDVSVLGSSSPASPTPTFSWSRLDPSAPNRIVRAATRGRRSSALDYMVLMDPAGPAPLAWSAFLRNGSGIYNASPDGRRVTKVSG